MIFAQAIHRLQNSRLPSKRWFSAGRCCLAAFQHAFWSAILENAPLFGASNTFLMMKFDPRLSDCSASGASPALYDHQVLRSRPRCRDPHCTNEPPSPIPDILSIGCRRGVPRMPPILVVITISGQFSIAYLLKASSHCFIL